jgi:hypothetical protein
VPGGKISPAAYEPGGIGRAFFLGHGFSRIETLFLFVPSTRITERSKKGDSVWTSRKPMLTFLSQNQDEFS